MPPLLGAVAELPYTDCLLCLSIRDIQNKQEAIEMKIRSVKGIKMEQEERKVKNQNRLFINLLAGFEH